MDLTHHYYNKSNLDDEPEFGSYLDEEYHLMIVVEVSLMKTYVKRLISKWMKNHYLMIGVEVGLVRT